MALNPTRKMAAFLAAVMLVGPTLGIHALETLAQRDWEACFYGAPRIASFTRDYLTSLWTITVTYPFGIALLCFGTAAASLLWAVTRSPFALGIWALIVAFSVVFYLNPGAWHDCDRKGPDGVFGVVMVQGLGFLLTLAALPFFIRWRSKRPRPLKEDPSP